MTLYEASASIPEEVKVEQDAEGHLSIIAEGLLYRVTLWETPILALVSELYYKMLGAQPDMEYTERTIISKARKLAEHGITFSMFGIASSLQCSYRRPRDGASQGARCRLPLRHEQRLLCL